VHAAAIIDARRAREPVAEGAKLGKLVLVR